MSQYQFNIFWESKRNIWMTVPIWEVEIWWQPKYYEWLKKWKAIYFLLSLYYFYIIFSFQQCWGYLVTNRSNVIDARHMLCRFSKQCLQFSLLGKARQLFDFKWSPSCIVYKITLTVPWQAMPGQEYAWSFYCEIAALTKIKPLLTVWLTWNYCS